MSLLEVLKSTDFAGFKAECARIAQSGKAPAELQWWLAECHRVQAAFQDSDRWLGSFLATTMPGAKGVGGTSDSDRIYLLARFLEDQGYNNGALLECFRRLCAADSAKAEQALREFRRGSFHRLVERTRK